MPKTEKKRMDVKTAMEALVQTVEADAGLLELVQSSYIPRHRKELTSCLEKCFAGICPRKARGSKDIYSDFFRFLQYVTILIRRLNDKQHLTNWM